MLKKGNLFKRFFQGVDTLFTGRGKIDDDLLDALEEALYAADLSPKTSEQILSSLREDVREERLSGADQVRDRLKRALIAILEGEGDVSLKVAPDGPTLYLIVGVNGVGKTTSLGKMAYRASQEGKKVMLVAGDTFRAAAADQLGIWAERAGADLIRQHEHSDPAAVVHDAIVAAKTRGTDLILVDTAGRLHTKINLMEELKKIGRTCERELGRKPDEVLLALDATTGQNALRQAQEFTKAVGITGLVLAKLDGTARGGIVVTLREELGVPVKVVGVGEGIGDIQTFQPEAFVDSLLAVE
jgi:fused signal recognition particle receptor